jgi:hypothetical protein
MQKMLDLGRLTVHQRMETVLAFAEDCGRIKNIQMIRAANFV